MLLQTSATGTGDADGGEGPTPLGRVETNVVAATCADAAHAETGQAEPLTPRKMTWWQVVDLAWRRMSYVWSTALLLFALVVVLYGIAMEWNNPPWGGGSTHPALEILLFVVLLGWVAVLEGAQVSIIGLQAVDIELIRHSHPRSYRCCKVVHSGSNVERFIVGRQFLVLFLVFLISRIGGAGPMSQQNFYIGNWKWSSEATQFFWVNSVLLIIIIIVPGNLVTQLMAARKMLDFLELPFAAYYTVVLPSLGLEAVGLTHTAYLLKDAFLYLVSLEPEADDSRRMPKTRLYYAKCVVSVCAVIFSAVFVVKGLFAKQSNATNGVGWDKLPGWAAFMLTLFFLFFIGCCEGFQIAAVALFKLPLADIRTKAPIAHVMMESLRRGRNVQAFLVGRQVFVAMMMVLLAKATSYAGSDGELVTGSDWGMGPTFNEVLLQTGILGAIFVVNVGQLSFRMAASCFPVLFINNRLMYGLLKIAMAVEATGIVNSCWPLAWLLDALFGLRKDPFDEETPAQTSACRKKSLGISELMDIRPRDHRPPDTDFHIVNSHKVSYI